MAYRIEENVTWRDMWYNLQNFLTELTTIYDISYDSATGNGILNNLSVPSDTATSETWSIICLTDKDYTLDYTGNTGDGTLTALGSVHDVDATDIYTIECIDATVPATFSVVGSVSGATTDATSDVAYDDGVVSFTIVAGATPWVVGDTITLSVASATFSVTGTVTTATANATAEVPYDNGIIKFTITVGITPWNVGDIVSFTSEATTSPPWVATTVDNEPIQLVCKMYNSNGSEKSFVGYVRAIEGPKIGSSAMTPLNSVPNTTYLGTLVSGANNVEDDVDYTSITYWLHTPNPDYSGTNSYGGLFDYGQGDNYGPGPMSISHSGFDIRAYGDTYSSVYTYPSTITLPSDFYIDNNIDMGQWIFVHQKQHTSSADMYYNNIYLGNLSQAQIRFSCVLINYPIADVTRWDHNLDAGELQQLIEGSTVHDINGVDILSGYYYKQDDLMPLIAVSNIDSDGNEIAAVMLPQKSPYYSYYLSAVSRGLPVKGNLTELEMLEYSRDQTAGKLWNDSSGLANYMIGGDPNQVVAKTWFVSTEDFIIIAYKIYDPTTLQQLPVYQIGYIGRTNTAEEMEYKAVIGSYTSSAAYWYSSSTALRSGVYYSTNARFFSLTSYAAPTSIYYSAYGGVYEKIANSYNIFPITYYQSSYNRSFGELYNIYGVQVLDVNHEDEFTIDGERYIALGDWTRAGSNSLILLKLG